MIELFELIQKVDFNQTKEYCQINIFDFWPDY